MKVTIINPNIVTQKGDFFGTGIPYMPIIPAYIASYLIKKKQDIQVIDAFGIDPCKKRETRGFIIQGLGEEEIIDKIDIKSDLICIYASHMVEHGLILKIIKLIKKRLNIPIVVVENSQAVTAYSLVKIKEDFFDMGSDFLIQGDPEQTIFELLNNLQNKKDFSKIRGLIYKKNGKIKVNKLREPVKEIDKLPFPAWDLFPVKNYWKLKYAHAPYNKSYLPIISSRGCPYCCKFCVIPFVNKRRWRGRSPANILEEMKFFIDKYSVKEFHFEDLNPIINKKRIEDLCRLIIKNNLKIKIKFASGTKIDVFDESTVRLLKKAGCDYISFSPESGSEKVLKLMCKPFDHKKALRMLGLMNKLKIPSQACFILGFPGEKNDDLLKTKKYIISLFKKGLDEVVIPIMTPLPGSEIFDKYKINLNLDDLSKLTFSPVWRKDYRYLNKVRWKLYFYAYLTKFFYHPVKFLITFINAFFFRFKNKSEMTLYRMIKVNYLMRSRK